MIKNPHVVQIGMFATMLVAIILTLVVAAYLSGRKESRKQALLDLALLGGFLGLLYYFFPWAFSFIVYQGIILHGFGALPAVLGVFAIVRGLKLVTGEPSVMASILSLKKTVAEATKEGSTDEEETDETTKEESTDTAEPTEIAKKESPVTRVLHRNAAGDLQPQLASNGVMYIFMGLLFIHVGPELVLTLNHAHIAKVYAFAPQEKMIVMSKKIPRFTPQEVAFAKLKASLTSSEYRIDLEHTQPCDVDGGFGYVATLMPQGVINIFNMKVPGFLIYDDHPELKEEKRIRRINQQFEYGMGMQWRDSIYRRLARYNPFCTYGEPYPLQLSENKDEFTLVAPKISYRLDFPCFWVPYQSGVVLIHGNGKLEEVSMAQIKEDARFTKKRLMCVDLIRLIIEKQIYDEGYLRAWYTRPGLIKIPELPGATKQPFLLTEEDGTEYYVTLVEPVGNQALMRMYYINATTGERTRYDCDPNTPIPGPEVSIQAVKALQGYKWIEHSDVKEKQDGNFHIVEPRIMSPGGEPFYLFSVTTKNFFEIALTCVVEPRSNQLHTFANRHAFEKWMRGEKVPEGAGALQLQNLDEIQRLLQEALEKIEALKE